MDLTKQVSTTQARDKRAGSLAIRAGIQILLALLLWGGSLFWSAGAVAWPRGWIHLALWVVTFVTNLLVLCWTNPPVLAARIKRQRFESRFDKILMTFTVLPATMAIPIVAGLDAVRYRWAPLPAWTIYLAVIFHIAGDALLLWAMAVNPYLEKSVRIQKDQGHHVVTTGPYVFLRHPMYAGIIPLMVGVPLTLGSGYAFIPVVALVIILVIRTVFEDQTLIRDLPGYNDYAKRTPYRLLPGVW